VPSVQKQYFSDLEKKELNMTLGLAKQHELLICSGGQVKAVYKIQVF
jgi:hypothetical protein